MLLISEQRRHIMRGVFACFLLVVLYAMHNVSVYMHNVSVYRDLIDAAPSETKTSFSHDLAVLDSLRDSREFLLDESLFERYEEFGYRSLQEMLDRVRRFPSIDDRIKLYMSNWYLPLCSGDKAEYEYFNEELLLQEIGRRTFQLDSFFDGSLQEKMFDFVHFIDLETMYDCPHRYCIDTVDFLLPALNRTSIGAVPILYQFGDDWRTRAVRVDLHHGIPKLGLQPHFPVIKKIRKSLPKIQLDLITSSKCVNWDQNQWHPIVFKLKTNRHYGRIPRVAESDIPWSHKKNVAVFRGALNGKYDMDMNLRKRNMTVLERCSLLPRCWIPLIYKNSTLVDAKLTRFTEYDEMRMLPPIIEYNGEKVHLSGDEKAFEELLQYKGLIMLEGNDVSSGLKWALYSNSIVLIPTPVYTSWCMEELLQPWVHYIPIDPVSTTDIEEKMQWVLENDDKAQQIARNGQLWISDLVLHPSVQEEEELIFDEIMRRYAQHFRPAKAPLPRRESTATTSFS